MTAYLTTLVVVAALAAGVAAYAGVLNAQRRIDHLQARVHCLEHPTWGASSIAGAFIGTGKNRHFVVTQPASATQGCS